MAFSGPTGSEPILPGRTVKLHAGVVLLAVAAGGSLYGIVGALLAVPVVAVIAEVARYVSETMDARAGEAPADDQVTGDDADGPRS